MDRLRAILDDTKASPVPSRPPAAPSSSASEFNLDGVAATMKADQYESLRDRVEALEYGRHPSPSPSDEAIPRPDPKGRSNPDEPPSPSDRSPGNPPAPWPSLRPHQGSVSAAAIVCPVFLSMNRIVVSPRWSLTWSSFRKRWPSISKIGL